MIPAAPPAIFSAKHWRGARQWAIRYRGAGPDSRCGLVRNRPGRRFRLGTAVIAGC